MQPSNLTRAIIDKGVKLSVKVLDKETGMDDHRGQSIMAEAKGEADPGTTTMEIIGTNNQRRRRQERRT
jgi:hypothetical protein